MPTNDPIAETRRAPSTRWWSVMLRQRLALLLLVTLVLKLIAIFIYVPGSATLVDVGFGFEGYVQSLIDTGRYASCDDAGCDYAARMPGLPYFLYAMSFFTQGLRTVTVVKACLLTGLLLLSCQYVAGTTTSPARWLRWATTALVIFLALSPNLVKHAAMPFYEEGYLVEMLAILTVSAMGLLGFDGKRAPVLRYVLPVVTASMILMFKSSMLLLGLVACAAVVCAAVMAGRRRLAALLMALALAAPLAWTVHNGLNSGRFTLMSSYDGENIFRGWNAHTLALYPQCSLDWLFQPGRVCGTRTVNFQPEPRRAGFATEWQWNDYYTERAATWIVEHPQAALETLWVKFSTFFFSVRVVPHYRVTEDASAAVRSYAEEALAGAWLALGRGVQIAWLLSIAYVLRRGDRHARRIGVTALCLPLAYAAPYVLGFGYERHFSPFIMLVALAEMFVLRQVARIRSNDAALPVNS